LELASAAINFVPRLDKSLGGRSLKGCRNNVKKLWLLLVVTTNVAFFLRENRKNDQKSNSIFDEKAKNNTEIEN